MAKKSQKITLGPGIAAYPKVDRPDTKFDENGQYSCDIVMPEAEAAPIMKRLSDYQKDKLDKAPSKSGNSMWEPVEDEDGNPTGDIKFKIKVKNRISKKTGKLWDRRPKVFDAAGKLIEGETNLGGGSRVKVSCELYDWESGGKNGISLQLQAIQILELVEYTGGGADASEYGFGEEEGYVADEGETFPDHEEDEDEDNSDF